MKALLIRHAASTGQAPDAPLSAAGYQQAQDLVPLLAKLRAGPLYASPHRRAQDTIAPYAAASAQKVVTLDELRERMLSPIDLPDWKDHVRRSFTDSEHAPQGGESFNDLRFRATSGFRKIQLSGGALPAFVTHGNFTSALFSAVDPAFGYEEWHALRNPDLFEVVISERRITKFKRIKIEVLS